MITFDYFRLLSITFDYFRLLSITFDYFRLLSTIFNYFRIFPTIFNYFWLWLTMLVNNYQPQVLEVFLFFFVQYKWTRKFSSQNLNYLNCSNCINMCRKLTWKQFKWWKKSHIFHLSRWGLKRYFFHWALFFPIAMGKLVRKLLNILIITKSC